MNRIKEWYRSLTRNEKAMFIFIIALLIGVAVRWGYIREKTVDAFKDRFEDTRGSDEGDNGAEVPVIDIE